MPMSTASLEAFARRRGGRRRSDRRHGVRHLLRDSQPAEAVADLLRVRLPDRVVLRPRCGAARPAVASCRQSRFDGAAERAQADERLPLLLDDGAGTWRRSSPAASRSRSQRPPRRRPAASPSPASRSMPAAGNDGDDALRLVDALFQRRRDAPVVGEGAQGRLRASCSRYRGRSAPRRRGRRSRRGSWCSVEAQSGRCTRAPAAASLSQRAPENRRLKS